MGALVVVLIGTIFTTIGRGERHHPVIHAEPMAGHLLYIGERHAVGPGNAGCRGRTTRDARLPDRIDVTDTCAALSLWCGRIHYEVSFPGSRAVLARGLKLLQRNHVMVCGQLWSARCGRLEGCWRPQHDCFACSRSFRRAVTGRAQSWLSASK